MKAAARVWLLVPLLAAAADDISIHRVSSVPHDPRQLTVQFDQPGPSNQAALTPGRWSAQCFENETTVPIDLRVAATEHLQPSGSSATFQSTPTVRLTFDRSVTDECQMVAITFLAAKFPSSRWMKKQKPSTDETEPTSILKRIFSPVGAQDSPDFSISGTVVPAVGSGPVYSIDASLTPKFIRGAVNSLGFTGVAKTDSSKTADPDSFSWSLDWLHVPDDNPAVKVGFAGMEFDKANNVSNFISSGSLIWTHFWLRTDTQGKLKYSASLDLRGGIEIGDNLKNSYAAANVLGHEGSGFLFRGVPRARFAFVIPTSNPKHAIRFTSTYVVRLPATDEIFLETRLHTKDAVQLLGTSPRHYVENNVMFKATDYFGFTLQHSYGTLPPAFKFVDHRGSIGIVFQAKQP